MKRTLTLLTIFLAFGSLPGQPYFFYQSTDAYTELSGGTSANGSSTWSGFSTLTIPIGFNFEYMGNTYTSVKIEATGRLIFDASHFYWADLFTINGMQDKGAARGTASQSPVTYELSGSPGSQILKIQVKDATYAGDTASTANFQYWLYEQISKVELHVGPHTIVDPGAAFGSGAFSGVFHINSFTPINYVYALAGYGPANMPNDSTFTGSSVSTSGILISGIPSEGMIYTYSEEAPLASEKQIIEDFSVYPNPVSDHLRILSNYSWNGNQATIYDLHGKVVAHLFVKDDQINLPSLHDGIYFVEIASRNGTLIREKFIKH